MKQKVVKKENQAKYDKFKVKKKVKKVKPKVKPKPVKAKKKSTPKVTKVTPEEHDWRLKEVHHVPQPRNRKGQRYNPFGKLDVLVNNAGLGMRPFSEEFMELRPKFWEADIEQVQMTFDTNTIGPFQMAAHAVPHMLKRGWGRLVNVTTSIGTMQRKGFFPYGPSKTALEASTRIWAEDLESTGITSNVLIPGRAANTDIMPTAWRNSLEHPDGREPVEPDVMGPPILWLASNASDGITGQRFEADIWDTTIDPTSAAQKQIRPAGFELRPRAE